MIAEQTVTEAWDMKCPRCSRDDRIEIQLTVWASLDADGTEIKGQDHEWHPRSVARCDACDHYGTVNNFTSRRSTDHGL